MKTISSILLFCFFIGTSLYGQNLQFEWAFRIPNTDYYAWVTQVVVANDGSVYHIGTFQDTVDFDPGVGTFEMMRYVPTNYIAKYDASGNFIWAKKFNGTPFILDCKTDHAGNVYLSGSVHDLMLDTTFTNNPITITSNGPTDAIILKLNSFGQLQWIKTFGNSEYGDAQTFCVDEDENVYVFGNFGGLTDFDPGPGVYNLNSKTPFCDFYLMKLDANGDFTWAKAMGGNQVDAVYNCCFDHQHNIYITGRFSDSVDFDPGVTEYKISAGAYDSVNNTWPANLFLLKIDTSGNFKWVKQTHASISDYPKIIADMSGNVYLADQFLNSIKFAPGGNAAELNNQNAYYDGYIAQWDSSGNFMWANQLAGTGNCKINAISTDDAGNILIGGYFKDTLKYNINNLNDQFVSPNKSADIFFMKLNMLGNNLWSEQIGKTRTEQLTGIALHNDELYITGTFADTLDFDPANTEYLVECPKNKLSGYLCKFNQHPNLLENMSPDEQRLLISPNPNEGRFTIELSTNATLSLSNAYGQIVYSENCKKGTCNIHIPNLPDGIYVLQMKSEYHTISEKMLRISR